METQRRTEYHARIRSTQVKHIHETIEPVARPERILQFGEGNFLRAFVDWMVDIANEKTDFNGNVAIVQPLERGMADMINAQKGLYTTVLRGVHEGKEVSDLRAIRCVSRCLNAYSGYEDYMALADSPELRFVVSNTTEAGIAWADGERLEDRPQASFPGKVTAFLYRRWRHFRGDASKGLVFIPCELIDKNGDKLRELTLAHAAEWKLEPAFVAWVENDCDFCNSLVDRIVPGYPKDEAPALCERAGYRDDLFAAAEIFHLWVIETKRDYRAEFPLAAAGLNVIWTEDMSFYRTRKVRILNGTHTMIVAAAFLAGLDAVDECMKDKTVRSFLEMGLFGEIIPSMDGNVDELTGYAKDVLERFANPWIKHLLLSISLNSVSKFKTRDLPSLTGYIAKRGTVPPALAFSLAALIAFYEGVGPANGELSGTRKGIRYPIKDDLPVLERFAALYAVKDSGAPAARATRITRAVLSETAWWGENLTALPGLEAAVSAGLEAIWTVGAHAALESLVAARKA